MNDIPFHNVNASAIAAWREAAFATSVGEQFFVVYKIEKVLLFSYIPYIGVQFENTCVE